MTQGAMTSPTSMARNHQCSNLDFFNNFSGHTPLPCTSPASTTVKAPQIVAIELLSSLMDLECFPACCAESFWSPPIFNLSEESWRREKPADRLQAEQEYRPD